MNDTGHGGFPAGANICGGARNGPCCGKATKQGRPDIGETLRQNFCIRSVVTANHSVCNHRGQQRFNACEERNNKGRGQQFKNFFKTDRG
jgi:hypothetical protein